MRLTSIGTPAEALAALEQSAAAGEPYQLLLIDQTLRDMEGLTLIEHLRQRAVPTPPIILMLTSNSHSEDAQRCLILGVQTYLIKPIRLRELRDALVAELTRSLPIENNPQQPTAVATHTPAAQAPLRILVAEDNPVNQLVMKRLLQKRGHEVSIVADGRKAIEAVRTITFDVVFMDVQMPEVDGLQATQEIRQRETGTGTRIPIVALTAHAMKSDMDRCLQAGMDQYLTKPINPDELDAVLDSYARNNSSNTNLAALPSHP